MSTKLSAGGKRPAIETHLKRFEKSYRKRLRKLAKTSPRLGDLLFSFPGAAFAMVSGHGAPQARGQAVKLVKEGAGLGEIAETLGLPIWMRRLPPEAFRAPLPAELGTGAEFDRRVVNLIPTAPDAVGLWLECALAGLAACDERFAAWVAGQDALRKPEDPERSALTPAPSLRLLGLYAWVSQREGLLAHRFIDLRWNKHMRLDCAVEQTRQWLERIASEYCRGEQSRAGMWLKAQKVAGFTFSPRLTATQLAEEGRVMNNCVGSYAAKVERGQCLIYALRRGGRSVATLEIVADDRKPGKGRVAQLEGFGNGPPPAKAVQAVTTWMSRIGPCPLSTPGLRAKLIDPARWGKIWGPVWEARGWEAGPGFEPTIETFIEMERELAALMRIARF